MGQVFAAVHERMEREVALKILSPDVASDPQVVARFIQEARILAQLEHPGVVRILGCETLGDGTTYLAMERVDGISLREWIQRRRAPAPLDEAAEIAEQIAEVMADVHAKGVIHRDLKPDNVMLLPDEGRSSGHRVKLLDFGVAKAPPAADAARVDTQVQTMAPILLGTATYMAPEQCRNAAAVTDRADVYALGVLLFELLAGRPPFISDEPVDILAMHVRVDPPSLRELRPEVPAAFAAFLSSMLAKDPAVRPSMRRCREVLGKRWEGARDEPPLPGIAPFTEEHAELFFGRDAEVEELLGLLERARVGELRWIQLEGPSGAGKSSLVQAGLLPRLREAPRDAPARWRIVVLRLSLDPFGGIARALTEAGREPVLLVIEQLEELLSLSEDERHKLDEILSRALTAQGSPLRLFTTLRSDFIHRLEHMPLLAACFRDAVRIQLRPMEEGALIEVILGMARRAGLRISEGLPQRMARDAAGEGSQLALLGHFLLELWSLHGSAPLTHERYEKLGGVGRALTRHAELLLDGLGEEGRERAKWILLSLVQVGRGAPDTGRARIRQEVLAAAGGDALAEQVLLRLSGELPADPREPRFSLRLLGLSGEPPESGRQRVDLVQELLLREVPTIARWIDEERALLERRADLDSAASAWEQAGCPAEGLPSGALLHHYQGRIVDERRPGLLLRIASPPARRFLDEARRLDRRRGLLRRAVLAAFVGGAALIALSAVRASRAQHRAEANLQHVILATEQVVSEADWALGRLHHTTEVRRGMLRHIDENLASLPGEERGKPEVIKALVQTKHRLSDFARLNESLARADGFLEEALVEIRRGGERSSAGGDIGRLLALNHSKRGKVALARGRYEEARAHFADALRLLELPGGRGGGADDRRTLATSYSEQADLAMELGRTEEAAPLYDRAVALLEQNDSAYDRSILALALCSRGEAARRAGELPVASSRLGRALEIQGALVEGARGNAFYGWILSRVHVELAALRTAEGALDAASEHQRAAEALGRALHKGDPTNKSYAQSLLQSLVAGEDLARGRGELARAEEARAERCALAAAFVRADGEDVRFQRLACR